MTWKGKLTDTRNGLRNMSRMIPDTMRAFGGLGRAVKDNGVLDLKTKEFVALGISITERCDPCIALHVEAAIKAGASREEVSDVLAMTIQMGGGPAMMYAAKALECYDELAA